MQIDIDLSDMNGITEAAIKSVLSQLDWTYIEFDGGLCSFRTEVLELFADENVKSTRRIVREVIIPSSTDTYYNHDVYDLIHKVAEIEKTYPVDILLQMLNYSGDTYDVMGDITALYDMVVRINIKNNKWESY